MWTSFGLHEQTCHQHPFLNTIDPLLAIILPVQLFQIRAGRFYISLLNYKTITVSQTHQLKYAVGASQRAPCPAQPGKKADALAGSADLW